MLILATPLLWLIGCFLLLLWAFFLGLFLLRGIRGLLLRLASLKLKRYRWRHHGHEA